MVLGASQTNRTPSSSLRRVRAAINTTEACKRSTLVGDSHGVISTGYPAAVAKGSRFVAHSYEVYLEMRGGIEPPYLGLQASTYVHSVTASWYPRWDSNPHVLSDHRV